MQSFRSDAEQRHTPLAIYNEDSADIQLARRLADEAINVSGAEVLVFQRTNNSDYDTVFDEDTDPTYWPALSFKAYFKPEPLQVTLEKWGAEGVNKAEVVFNHHQLFSLVGERMLRAGDVIQLPHNTITLKPKNYRVLNGSPTGNFRYTWLYFTCQVETLTADITVRVEDDLPPTLENEAQANGVYRESL